ncbi:MAG: alpha/beta fold hydrolase [Thermoplasmata archaeon]|nr:alpha/beta fold hydrolase [Thermoplasmata archaeon]
MVPAAAAELFVRREGAGPPIVLLHGIAGDHTMWSAVARDLARDHLVLAPDLRGHGKSPLPEGSTMSFSELARDVLAMLNREKVESAHLVGLSAGGFLALTIALGQPQRVRSVVLVSSAGHCDRHTRSIGERWVTTYREEGLDSFTLRLLKDLYYPDWIENHMEVADRLRESLAQADLTATLAWSTSIREFDTRGRLIGMRAPLLVIQGMDDQVIDASHARLLRQTIQGTEVRLLAQTGHMVPVERPTETAEAIRGWVGRRDPRPPA